MRSLTIAIFFTIVVISVQAQEQPCGKGETCPEGECCMITGNRYGLPACKPLRKASESCRPNSKPEEFELSSSPFGPSNKYSGVYWAVCPCQTGLQCNAGTCA